MKTQLSIEEREVLESVSEFIPLTGEFDIQHLHHTHVLYNKYPEHNNQTLSDISALVQDYKSRKVYDNITYYLIATCNANYSGNSGKIALTKQGEVMHAYGNFFDYLGSYSEIPTSDIIGRVPRLLSQIPPYGEFIIDPMPEGVLPRETIEQINDANDPKKQLIRLHEENVKNEQTLDYLVSQGFAINRNDLKSEGNIYRQLTDKGRALKEAGTISNFHIYQKKEDDILNRQRRQNEYMFWVIFFGAVGTRTSAAYDLMQSFDFYGHHTVNWQHVAYFSTGAAIGLLSALILSLLWKYISRLRTRP